MTARLVWVSLAGLFGIGLIAAAFPRIGAHMLLVTSGATRAALDDGLKIDPDELIVAYAAYDKALAHLSDDPELLLTRARIARRMAKVSAFAEQRGAEKESIARHGSSQVWREWAVRDLRHAAAVAPGDGVVWATLAHAEIEAGSSVEATLPALRLARLTAPARASALLLQFQIVMRHWAEMPEDMRAHALAKVPAFWRRARLRPVLIEAYLEADFAARSAFRERFAEDTKALLQFDRQVSALLGA